MRDLKKLQDKLDVIKWLDSENRRHDMCGTYSYCVFCNKYIPNPCAVAMTKYMNTHQQDDLYEGLLKIGDESAGLIESVENVAQEIVEEINIQEVKQKVEDGSYIMESFAEEDEEEKTDEFEDAPILEGEVESDESATWDETADDYTDEDMDSDEGVEVDSIESLGKTFDYEKVMFKKERRMPLTFAEKYVLASQDLKERYKIVEQEILRRDSKKDIEIKGRVNKHCHAFRYNGEIVIKITIIGRSLRINLALDPTLEEFCNGTMPHLDMSHKRVYEIVPFQLKMNSKLGVKRACKLVNILKDNIREELDASEGVTKITH